MPRISIIVPVYNVEEYLQQCVQSLIDQTFTDIEILLMDDASTDGSPIICDAFAAKDERVKVFHLNHAGVSAARNRGIEAAEGEFLMFADSDDWVDPVFCEVPLETALREGADVVMFGSVREGTERELFSVPARKGPLSYEERFTLFEELHSDFAWNKIYRRELFENIRFPEGVLYEDVAITYKIFHEAGKVWYIDDTPYHYRVREGSTTATATHENENYYFEARMESADDLESWGMEDEAEKLRCKACFTYILRMDTRGKYSAECADYFRKNGCREDVMSRKARLMVRMFLLFPPLFRLISRAYGISVRDRT